MKAAGAAPSKVFAVGGGAASDYWLSAIATVLGLPVIRPEKGDYGAAFGAARLAIMAAGDGDESIATPPRAARVFEPDRGLSEAFEAACDRYRRTYSALREIS
jgi:xylulokinase